MTEREEELTTLLLRAMDLNLELQALVGELATELLLVVAPEGSAERKLAHAAIARAAR
jgi:hypothetical protein